MSKFILSVGVSALLVSACASHSAALTSGQIGCPTEELKITSQDVGWSTKTWTAECRGKTFYCTYMTSYNLGSGVQCKEEMASVSK